MEVRPARSEDFDAVIRLLEHLGRPTITPRTRTEAREIYCEQLRDPNTEHLVAVTPRDRGCTDVTLQSSYARKDAHLLYVGAGMQDTGKFFRKRL